MDGGRVVMVDVVGQGDGEAELLKVANAHGLANSKGNGGRSARDTRASQLLSQLIGSHSESSLTSIYCLACENVHGSYIKGLRH
jgi:hypothetical protein